MKQTLLFSIGGRICLYETAHYPLHLGECVGNGERLPTPLLKIGVFRWVKLKVLSQVNKDQHENRHIAISLFNGPINFAGSG